MFQVETDGGPFTCDSACPSQSPCRCPGRPKSHLAPRHLLLHRYHPSPFPRAGRCHHWILLGAPAVADLILRGATLPTPCQSFPSSEKVQRAPAAPRASRSWTAKSMRTVSSGTRRAASAVLAACSWSLLASSMVCPSAPAVVSLTESRTWHCSANSWPCSSDPVSFLASGRLQGDDLSLVGSLSFS